MTAPTNNTTSLSDLQSQLEAQQALLSILENLGHARQSVALRRYRPMLDQLYMYCESSDKPVYDVDGFALQKDEIKYQDKVVLADGDYRGKLFTPGEWEAKFVALYERLRPEIEAIQRKNLEEQLATVNAKIQTLGFDDPQALGERAKSLPAFDTPIEDILTGEPLGEWLAWDPHTNLHKVRGVGEVKLIPDGSFKVHTPDLGDQLDAEKYQNQNLADVDWLKQWLERPYQEIGLNDVNRLERLGVSHTVLDTIQQPVRNDFDNPYWHSTDFTLVVRVYQDSVRTRISELETAPDPPLE